MKNAITSAKHYSGYTAVAALFIAALLLLYFF